MLILSRIQAKSPGGGYLHFRHPNGRSHGRMLRQKHQSCFQCGRPNPQGCADGSRDCGSAWVESKHRLCGWRRPSPRLTELIEAGNDFTHLDTGESLGDLADRIVTANAYIGCWGIVETLDQGADIVVTGRATDAAVIAGPAAWYHGWQRDDWDALAGAIVAGHVIECGTGHRRKLLFLY